jgi:hypothetical protein
VPNIEEKTRKVLKALPQCERSPFYKEECGDCPYIEEERCIAHLCRDAYSVITTLDTTINAMMGNYGDTCDVDSCHPNGGDA